VQKRIWIVALVVAVLLVGNGAWAADGFYVVKAACTDEQYPPNAKSPAPEMEKSALPDPKPGETLAYFFPSDNDATATVIFLLNTDSVAHIVALRGYSINGTLFYSLNINIPATSMRRLASDSIVASPPPSWAGPTGSNPNGVAPIITNFTDSTYFASLSLPKGVGVSGYTLFNPGTGVVDPRLDQGAIPLQFIMKDKPSVAVIPLF
jgi:hypothetical protein